MPGVTKSLNRCSLIKAFGHTSIWGYLFAERALEEHDLGRIDRALPGHEAMHGAATHAEDLRCDAWTADAFHERADLHRMHLGRVAGAPSVERPERDLSAPAGASGADRAHVERARGPAPSRSTEAAMRLLELGLGELIYATVRGIVVELEEGEVVLGGGVTKSLN